MVDAVLVKLLRSRGMKALPEPEAGEMIEQSYAWAEVVAVAAFHVLAAKRPFRVGRRVGGLEVDRQLKLC